MYNGLNMGNYKCLSSNGKEKTIFYSLDEAQRHCSRINRDDNCNNSRLKVYKCNICNHFHLTTIYNKK